MSVRFISWQGCVVFHLCWCVCVLSFACGFVWVCVGCAVGGQVLVLCGTGVSL